MKKLLCHKDVYALGSVVNTQGKNLDEIKVFAVLENLMVTDHQIHYKLVDVEGALFNILHLDLFPATEFNEHHWLAASTQVAKRLRDEAIAKRQPEHSSIEYHKSILQEAESLVHGDRNEDYGHPLDDFAKTAALWSVIVNVRLTPEQVALMMVALKISRQMHKPKRDNLVDMAGYAETCQMCIDERDKRTDSIVSFGNLEHPLASVNEGERELGLNVCKHGKGLLDYCEPCGRIHGG